MSDEDGAATECVFPPAGRDTTPRCRHRSVQRLGVDAGGNRYGQCRDCEAVVVTFTPDDGWERQREQLAQEERDWNPLLDALRSDEGGSERDPRRDDERQVVRQGQSLVARLRARLEQFWNRRR
jgi:hypothetical protein